MREYEDVDIQIRERTRESSDRTPAFLREEPKRTEAGPLVLRQREVETIERRPRSPSPVRMPSPPQIRERWIERTRSVSPPPARRPRFIERSPSPPPMRVDVDTRIIERRRPRSPTPDREREHIRIMMERERERAPSPSPSPPPPPPEPPVIRGPTIEREVITHYRDIDHGVERLKPPTPPPQPKPRRSMKEFETDIDIRHGHHEMDIDIRHSHSRSRSRAPEKAPERAPEKAPERSKPRQKPSYYDDELVIHTDRNRVSVTEGRRRAQSEAPRPEWDDEANYITGKIDSRGRMGEAYNGATKDWTIVDVPPGTERVKMDGVGGGGAEVSWQRYNGVRRSKFVAEREAPPPSSSSSTAVSDSNRERDFDRERERLSVQIYDSGKREKAREPETEEIHDRRITIRDGSRAPAAPPKRRNEMWTEITKDLVVREAIEQLSYEYEETEHFFYVMEYLRYEDVLQLVNISDEIRRSRRRRAREIEWEQEVRDSSDRRRYHHHSERRSAGWDKVDDERIIEREVVYDRGPVRGYLR